LVSLNHFTEPVILVDIETSRDNFYNNLLGLKTKAIIWIIKEKLSQRLNEGYRKKTEVKL
ncbi:hypothetical protein, partial [Vibrio cholerae]|uniref:hypothetical protein n=1 Tax=Vibrio cholerae TaxID=666 RepID=UPI002270B4B6